MNAKELSEDGIIPLRTQLNYMGMHPPFTISNPR